MKEDKIDTIPSGQIIETGTLNDIIGDINNLTRTFTNQTRISNAIILDANKLLEFYKDKIDYLNSVDRGLLIFKENGLNGSTKIVDINNTYHPYQDIVLSNSTTISSLFQSNSFSELLNILKTDINDDILDIVYLGDKILLSYYTDEKIDKNVSLRITFPNFVGNMVLLKYSDYIYSENRCAGLLFKNDTVVYDSSVNLSRITSIVNLSKSHFTKVDSSSGLNTAYNKEYVCVFLIERLDVIKLTTSPLFNTIIRFSKNAEDSVLDYIRLNLDTRFSNGYYSDCYVNIALTEEDAINSIYIETILLNSFGDINMNLPTLKYLSEFFVRLSINDTTRPIILKDLHIKFRVR